MDFFNFIIYNTNIVKYFCKGGGNMKGIDIAKYIVNRCYKKGKPITNLHLQKILYFVQGEYFAKTKKWLIDDDFLAWKYGPVLKDVYDEFSWHYASRIYETYDVRIPERIRKIIDPIIDEKRSKSAGALVNESHKVGGAWDYCYDGSFSTIIPKEQIEEEFSGME